MTEVTRALSAVEFEARAPNLTDFARRLLDVLANLGI